MTSLPTAPEPTAPEPTAAEPTAPEPTAPEPLAAEPPAADGTEQAWSVRGFRRANLAGAAATVAFGAALVLGAQAYAFRVGALPGPGLFPMLVGAALACFGALWLVGALRGRYLPDAEVEPPPDRGTLVKALVTFVVIGGYALLLRPLGYPLCTAVAVTLFTAVAGARWRVALIAGTTFAVTSFLLVTTALGIPLPYGVLRPVLGPLL